MDAVVPHFWAPMITKVGSAPAIRTRTVAAEHRYPCPPRAGFRADGRRERRPVRRAPVAHPPSRGHRARRRMAHQVPQVEGVKHSFVPVGDFQLPRRGGGEGDPVVLLHGWPEHWYAGGW